MALRVAEELGEDGESLVGYQIRFQDRTSPTNKIKFMTDGILLAETQQDPMLRKYDTLIIDEAHERSLNIDFLLGILRQLLPRRRDAAPARRGPAPRHSVGLAVVLAADLAGRRLRLHHP